MTEPAVHERLAALVRGADPVLSAVAAVLLIILGLLVIAYPVVLTWGIGIGLVLAGVALLAAVAAAGRPRS